MAAADGRRELVDEIANADEELRSFLQQRIVELLNADELVDGSLDRIGGGEHVPKHLEQARRAAWEARLAANRVPSCPACPVAACSAKAVA